MFLTKMIAAFIDVVLGVLRIGNILQSRIPKVFDHHIVTLLNEIHYLVEAVKHRLVKILVMDILSVEDTSDGLA